MKPEHTYCFYMKNGEHLIIDADSMTVHDEFITLDKHEHTTNFMCVYKKDLMAWEVIR